MGEGKRHSITPGIALAVAALTACASASYGADTVDDALTIVDQTMNHTVLTLDNGLTAPLDRDWSLENSVMDFGTFSLSSWDATAAETKTPLTVLHGAPDNTLFLDVSGRVGVGTSTPGGVWDSALHVLEPIEAGITLDNLGNAYQILVDDFGFAIYEEDTGNGPFFLDSGAPDYSIWVQSNGYLTLGSSFDPAPAKVYVSGNGADADAQVYVKNYNTVEPGKARKLFVIENDGPAKFSMWASETDEWAFNGRAKEFRISKQGTGEVEMELDDTGNLVVSGTVTQGSSRSIKRDIEDVDPEKVLDKVLGLDIATWSYNRDPRGIQHLGPMSEDFYQAFRLGASDKGLSSVDTGGVALAAIQGMHAQLGSRDVRISEQSARLVEQEKRLAEQAERLDRQSEKILQLEMALSGLLLQQSTEMTVGARQ